ncbi:MAG: zinc metalloprotease HtpX [Phycisphaerae bacterium]|nr:zinc metalloprotease HtpX [Phycisphaerae bacterium]
MGRLWNGVKTTLLMGSLMGLCLGVGYLVGGRIGIFYAFFFGGLMNLVAYFFSDKIALATMRAQEISPAEDPALWGIVEQLSQRAGLPMPRVYISPAAAPNAFATGRGPRHSAVCVTAGLRQMLNDEELRGVIAHELSHVKNRDILISTIAAILAGAISSITYMAMWGNDDRRSNPLISLLLMILAPMAAMLIQLAISRSREFEADRSGAELVGDPRGLARSLQKLEAANQRIPLPVPDAQSSLFIVQPLTGSNVAKLFSTHPPTEERVARLLAMERKY